MKIKAFTFLIIFTSLIISCKKKEELPAPSPKEGTLHVNEFDKVNINGGVVLHIHHSPQFAGEVKIKSESYDWSKVEVKSEKGELFIHVGDAVPASDIVIDIFVPVLSGIRLENRQHAIVHWDNVINISSLDIVTEAESKLEIYNLNANFINSKQEANSKIIISSAIAPVSTPAIFLGAVALNNKTLLVDNKMIVHADEVVLDNSTSPVSYKVHGSAISYNLIQAASFKGEGTSSIEISEMPVKNLSIKLEGESKANVWATNNLHGKGEGQTFLNYYGTPAIDYQTSGGAKIVKLPTLVVLN